MNNYEETAVSLEVARSYLTGIQDDLTRLEHNVGASIAHLDKAINALAEGEQMEGGAV